MILKICLDLLRGLIERHIAVINNCKLLIVKVPASQATKSKYLDQDVQLENWINWRFHPRSGVRISFLFLLDQVGAFFLGYLTTM